MLDLFGNYIEIKEKTQQEKYQEYISSAKWKRLRLAKIDSVGGRCERCGVSKFVEPLEVHHLHYRTFKKERLEDLQALCNKCHEFADAERQTIADLEKKAHQQSSSLYIGFIQWVKKGNDEELGSSKMFQNKQKFLTMLFNMQGKAYALDLKTLGYYDPDPNWKPGE
jgi:hypothetical protein